jgi:peptidoglycan/LPS O-acetylase OafA/YrhL
MNEPSLAPMRAEKLWLADILAPGQNNFDLIRLIAALAVIVGHSFYLFSTDGFREPVTILVNKNFTGTLAVGVFFFITGMLICQSFASSSAPFRFAIMRIARIYPGAILCLLVIVYVLGAIATSLPLGQYLTSSEAACYVRDNWSFFRQNLVCHTLPGVFTTNHIGPYPNGSLWTLPPEIICYVYVLIFGCLGCQKSTVRIISVLAGILLPHVISPSWVPYFSDTGYTDKLNVSVFFGRCRCVRLSGYPAALRFATLGRRSGAAEHRCRRVRTICRAVLLGLGRSGSALASSGDATR